MKRRDLVGAIDNLSLAGRKLVSRAAPRQGATVVTYGTLSPEPILVRNASLVYGNLIWPGFGSHRWSASVTAADAERMTAKLWAGIASGLRQLPIQGRFALAEFAEALRVTMAGGPGKVIVAPGRS